jgi:FixJ family two-component response regulator
MTPDPILIVDDEPDFRLPLKEALARDGYTVDDTDSATMALSLIEQKHYPVIVTDLHMPGGPSGLDLIAAVKARDPKALCVIITGYASLDVTVEAIKRGAYDFVQKPFKLVEIEAVLDRALEHARLLMQLEAYRKDLEERVVSRVKTLKSFHEEVLALNALLMSAQVEVDEKRLVEPFLKHLAERFAPDGYVVLLPDASQWGILIRKGERPWASLGSLPAPQALRETLEWGWEGGYPDGYLVPLRNGDSTLGALFLGFEKRSSFDPEDPSFILLKAQMQAAFHGLRCARDYAAAEVRKALGQSQR